jgi:carbohydrate-binding DOMON domain-containing protein
MMIPIVSDTRTYAFSPIRPLAGQRADLTYLSMGNSECAALAQRNVNTTNTSVSLLSFTQTAMQTLPF